MPRCAGPRSAGTAGSRRRCAAATCATRWPGSRNSARTLRAGAPIEIGALAGMFHVGEPDHELPRGTVSGSPERIAENLAELIDMGVSHLQMRFPNRPCSELCDQMAAFGEQVGPLLTR